MDDQEEMIVRENTPQQLVNFEGSAIASSNDEWTDKPQQFGNFESSTMSSEIDGWVDFGKSKQDNVIHFHETKNCEISEEPIKEYKTNLTYESLANLKESNIKPLTRLQNNQEEAKSEDNSELNSVLESTSLNLTGSSNKTPPRQQKKKTDHSARPATPSMKQRMNNEVVEPKSKFIVDLPNDEFADFPKDPSNACPIKIDVKPLPKIRLDLMPSPREVDEFEEGDY